MALRWSLTFIVACALLVGCAQRTRSISHSAYAQPQPSCGRAGNEGSSDPAFEYRGELSEFDVLGIDRNQIASEADIRRALEGAKPVKLRPGGSVLLIQSGSLIPDSPMVTELSKHFRVISFSGVPSARKGGTAMNESPDPEAYAKSLRLTAARGGADLILCYWGVLESENDRLPSKTLSWVPIAHWFVPDERQHMRIRLRVAVVDVRTGSWSTFTPPAFEDARASASPRRAAVDQKQVERLKKLAYEASVNEMMQGLN